MAINRLVKLVHSALPKLRVIIGFPIYIYGTSMYTHAHVVIGVHNKVIDLKIVQRTREVRCSPAPSPGEHDRGL